MTTNRMDRGSRCLIALAAACMVWALFVPLWRIELDAPQYPEGLLLQIYPGGLGGDVEIINGLNHYIGMQTLHSEAFIEFRLLPFFIAGFGLLFLLIAIMARRRWLLVGFWAFVLFGIIAMVDFWRWEYNYGHDLDPNAAIKVPGMAYQPPLIGFKQLLNFGAYSVPDAGGWLFILAGLCLLLAVVRSGSWLKKVRLGKRIAVSAACLLVVCCSQTGPQPIVFGSDKCEHCRMTIADPRFAVEIQTKKGRYYKFDDLTCLNAYRTSHDAAAWRAIWVASFDHDHTLVPVEELFFVRANRFKGPMLGDVAAFASEAAAKNAAPDSTMMRWADLIKLLR